MVDTSEVHVDTLARTCQWWYRAWFARSAHHVKPDEQGGSRSSQVAQTGGIHVRAANRQAAKVCMVRMRRQGPTLHLMQSIVRRFHVQSTDKVDDAPLVVQRQMATGQQGDVLVVPHQQQGPMINGGGNSMERHRHHGEHSRIPCGAKKSRSVGE